MRTATLRESLGSRQTTGAQFRQKNHGGVNNMSEKNDLMMLLHLFADGKLDRLDMQILRVQSEHSMIGTLAISKLLKVPRSTVQVRIKKIRITLS
jgi:hypothetical protein